MKSRHSFIHASFQPARLLLLCFASFALAASTSGAVKTWVGTTNSWGTASNWSPSGVPGSGDDPTIPTSPTGGNFPLISSGTLTVRNVTVQAGATLTLSGGTLTLTDLTIQAGSPAGAMTQTGGLLKVLHDWKNSGTFNATAGTVEFGGTASGSATFAAGTNQFFNLIVDATFDPHFDNIAGSTIFIRGDFTNNNKGLDNSTSASFTFNGSAGQSISSAASAGKSTFGNLTVNKSGGTATITSSLEVKGNATISSGTLEVFSFKRTAAGGTITISNNATLRIGGTNSFPANFNTHTLGASSTVEYSGTGQTVTLESYGNLILSGSNTKAMPASAMTFTGSFTMAGTAIATAANALTVNGDVSLGAGTTFSASSFSHQVKGNWTSAGTFNANTSTFTFNGAGVQSLNGGTFTKLTLNNASGLSLSSDITASDTLRLTSGIVTTGANNLIANGAVTRASGHVAGNLRKPVSTGANVSRTFEIGGASGYRPVNITFASVSAGGTLTAFVSQAAGEHPFVATSGIDSLKDVNRYWRLTNSGIAFTNYSATFNFLAADTDAAAGTNGFVVRRFNSPNWFTTTVGNRTSISTQATGITSFSDFAVGDTCVPPTTANAGTDQEVCSTSSTMSANTPTSGSGSWTVIAGSAIITAPTFPSSGVTGLSIGSNTFVWTINTSSCGSSRDTVTIVRDQNPTSAIAGPDQSVCSSTATLAGNSPTVGTGSWSVAAGSATVSLPSNPTSGVSGLSLGINTFVWTITNGACPASRDTVMIVRNEPPTTSDAGPDQIQCESSVATLAANAPTVGGGSWTVVSGSAGVTTTDSPTSGVTGLSYGANTFVWTITNGTCPPSRDTVTITRDQSPTTANAGTDQTACGLSTSLAGNAPSVGVGSWSQLTGPGTVTFSNTDIHTPGAAATASVAGVYTFEWRIINGTCESADTVEVTYVEPPTTSSAGSDRSVCGLSATLQGNTPTVGTGTWSKISGPGVANFTNTDEHTPGADVSVSQAGTYRFEWNVANVSCVSNDTVEIVFVEPPTAAAAGVDTNVCGFTARLNGNTPSIGTGTWSLVTGPGTASFSNADAHSPLASVEVSSAGTYKFEWMTANSGCESRDTVEIIFDGEVTTANAGSDKSVCGPSVALAGNTPLIGVGTWSQASGPGTTSFTNTDDHSPAATATVTAGGTYKFEWRIVNGTCQSTDTVEVTFVTEGPTIADAGTDRSVCGLSTALAGNTPVFGTGTWSTLSGPGTVTFSNVDAHSPGATATASVAGAYSFEWKISVGNCESKDTVNIEFVNAPAQAIAGPDQAVCSTIATLAGNSATSGSGTWSVVSGTATVTDPQLATSGVTGLAVGDNMFEWMITNGVCPVTRDTVTIRRDAPPTTANAGSNQTVSGTSTTLAGNSPVVGTGHWSLVSGAGAVTTTSSPTSTVTGLGAGSNVFRWTISNGSCDSSSSQVTIKRLIPTVSRLTQSAGTTGDGEVVIFRDSVGPAPDGGFVQFKDGGTDLGNSVGVNVNGIATLSISSLAAGSHAITAHFGGTSNYDSSTSNGLVHLVEIDDSTLFRTGTSEDWATAADSKGKLKSVKRKPTVVDFKLVFIAPVDAQGFALTFNMFSRGTITRGVHNPTVINPDSPWDSVKALTITRLVAAKDTFQLDGRGFKGKNFQVKVDWITLNGVTTVKFNSPSQFPTNQLRLPMPNLNNVGEELFAKGFGQTTTAFSSGLLVGVPRGTKGANSVKHFKFADVKKSFIKRTKAGDMVHDTGIRCLDAFDNGKLILKQQKYLAPNKQKNKVFGEVLALKLNVGASTYNKFPNGLGELGFDDPANPSNPFNGRTVNAILLYADTLLSCLTLESMNPDPTLGELYDVIRRIDTAFSGPIDTISFSSKTALKGARKLSDVPFLHKTSGATPLNLTSPDVVEAVPQEFTLRQNYPNPFNPTTTIEFSLPEPALVTLKVYNILGQEVATILEREEMMDGTSEFEFDAQGLASGVYFYRVMAEGIPDDEGGVGVPVQVLTRKMILLR